mmetsp:Transcript_9956/g.14940  ORF Transcript_9956/g.14940 Transcript_9956/m.14940 type:complete len:468 (+) Transcript_9956:52-1455(+)
MKPSRGAVSMAIIASTLNLGLARGFNIAKHLSRSSAGNTLTFRGAATSCSTPFRRSLHSTCFIPTDGESSSSKSSSSSSSALFSAAPAATASGATDTTSVNDDQNNEIEQAARKALTITGSLPPPCDFGGISYLDTSSLTENHSHRVLFILGGPGAGKGTQSERIVNTYKCVHLSVGDLLRSGAEKKDYPHADMVKECLVKGQIVPVELSLGLLRIAMDEKAQEAGSEFGSRIFLVDGFPRNYDNVEGWMEHMPSYTSVLGSLVYNCPIEVLEARIMTRAETSGRSDDNLDSARRRFQTFQTQTEPVVRALEMTEELQAEGNSSGESQLHIVNIDGTGTVEEVWDETEAAMNAYVKNDILTANMNLLKAIEGGNLKDYAALCDEQLLVESGSKTKKSIADIFEWYEGPISDGASSSISNAKVSIQDGIKALVSYDRTTKVGKIVRETREWEHGPTGWMCVSVRREDL